MTSPAHFSMPQVVVVLQCRTASARLPAKSLLPIHGIAMAELCARRLARGGGVVVAATTTDAADDALASLLAAAGFPVHRGDSDDVLARFVSATARLAPGDIVVRCTADNPLPDSSFVETAVGRFIESDTGYLGTDSPADGLPYGLSVEVTRVEHLRAASREAMSGFDREHVTPWIRRNVPGLLLDHTALGVPAAAQLRCTVDTLDDYHRVHRVFASWRDDPVAPSWQELLASLDSLPDSPRFRVPFRTTGGSTESVVAMGTAQLGIDYGIANSTGAPSEGDAIAMIRNAVEHGVTWIDTARVYGAAEHRIGKALLGSWGERARVATKLDTIPELPATAPSAWAVAAVDASVLRSLRELRRERLDVLMLHDWRHRTSCDGAIWRRMVEYRDDGTVAELGASVQSPAELLDAIADVDVAHVQLPLNILDHRWHDAEVLEAIQGRPGVRVHVRSVFLQGLVAADDDSLWPTWDVDREERVSTIRSLVAELGRDSTDDLCMAFARSFHWVHSLVLGAETPDQLRRNLDLSLRPPLTAAEAAHVVERLGEAPARLIDPSRW